MQPHIQKAYQFLDAHLPTNYVYETNVILKKANFVVSSDIIRNVRNKRTYNVDILNALLKVAKKQKSALDILKKETQI